MIPWYISCASRETITGSFSHFPIRRRVTCRGTAPKVDAVVVVAAAVAIATTAGNLDTSLATALSLEPAVVAVVTLSSATSAAVGVGNGRP